MTRLPLLLLLLLAVPAIADPIAPSGIEVIDGDTTCPGCCDMAENTGAGESRRPGAAGWRIRRRAS
jgi:hypothetical protein